MGENNTPTAIKGCGVKTLFKGERIILLEKTSGISAQAVLSEKLIRRQQEHVNLSVTFGADKNMKTMISGPVLT